MTRIRSENDELTDFLDELGSARGSEIMLAYSRDGTRVQVREHIPDLSTDIYGKTISPLMPRSQLIPWLRRLPSKEGIRHFRCRATRLLGIALRRLAQWRESADKLIEDVEDWVRTTGTIQYHLVEASRLASNITEMIERKDFGIGKAKDALDKIGGFNSTSLLEEIKGGILAGRDIVDLAQRVGPSGLASQTVDLLSEFGELLGRFVEEAEDGEVERDSVEGYLGRMVGVTDPSENPAKFESAIGHSADSMEKSAGKLDHIRDLLIDVGQSLIGLVSRGERRIPYALW